MDVAPDFAAREHPDSKHSDPPIGYINVRRNEVRRLQPAINVHQSEDDDDSSVDEQPREHATQQGATTIPSPLLMHRLAESRQSDGVLNRDMQSHFQALLPMLTSISSTERTSLTEHIYPTASSRDGSARFARAPSSSGMARHRGGPPTTTSPRDPPQRRDSNVTASESGASQSIGPSDQSRLQSEPAGTYPDGSYRRPGKHRVGESPTPEEYMALPPEAKKKVDNRLSARRSRAKRKEHVHILTTQIVEQQNTIEMLRIENKQLNDHIANLSRAGYSLHPPPFQPGIVPHPSPHLRHIPGPPSHVHPSGRQLPHLSGSPHRAHLAHSPTLSHPSSSSGLVAAAGPPIGPGHVPILGHNVASASRSDASGSNYVAQGQGGSRYDSPGRGTKREVDDEVDDRLRTRVRYTSPERMNWERESEGRRMSHSSYRSPSRSADYRSRYHPKQVGPSSRSPSPQPRWERLPPSLAARQDTAEEVVDYRVPIQISGQGLFSDRLATLIRVHKRAILTYQGARRDQMTEREEERMEGVLVAAEAIGKEVEELTEEFHYVGRHDGD